MAAYLEFKWLHWSVGGLLSPQYVGAQWNLGKIVDWLRHFWLPVAIIGAEGTAGVIRILRANLLDELHKPYVVTARSKGLSERRLSRNIRCGSHSTRSSARSAGSCPA